MFIEPDRARWEHSLHVAFNGVEMALSTRTALLSDLMNAFPWTKRVTEFEEVIRQSLHGQLWSWPLLDEWRRRFEAIGAVPYMWTSPSRLTGNVDDLGLLTHFVMAKGRHLQQFRPDLEPVWIAFSPAPEGPEVAAVVDEIIGDYVAGKPGVILPPFFPGDRTGYRVLPDFEYLVEDIRSRGKAVARFLG